ncbi:MAG: tRNA dihydrouridine synthase DusB [Chloroflexi bacterium]|nr:tRNA dihydrouridine synthase DusB [Chloroflexota bacterium]
MASLDIAELIRQAPVRLAPMASYTNVPFRRVAQACGSGFTTNEEIDADAFRYDNQRTLRMARMSPEDGVVAMQLLGCDPEAMTLAAVRLVEAGASIIDVNMGCPAPKVTKRGKGAALMRDLATTATLLKALRAAIDVPLTIKIRGGWSDEHLNAVEVACMAEECGVDAITVHPRTRSQQYTGHAPWAVIGEVVRAVSIPVTGNGDVHSMAEARRMMDETGCAGVMVGRAALGRPWLFDEAHETLSPARRFERERAVIEQHLALIEATMPPHEALLQTKKHLALYVAGRPEARPLKAAIFLARDLAAVRGHYEQAVEGYGSAWIPFPYVASR